MLRLEANSEIKYHPRYLTVLTHFLAQRFRHISKTYDMGGLKSIEFNPTLQAQALMA